MRDNALRDLTLINVTVDRFVGTGRFLIRYSVGHTKYRINVFLCTPGKCVGGEGIADWSASRSDCLTPAKGTLDTDI